MELDDPRMIGVRSPIRANAERMMEVQHRNIMLLDSLRCNLGTMTRRIFKHGRLCSKGCADR
jgi:hypothetical protein